MDKYERGEKQHDFEVPQAPPEGDPKAAKSHNALVFQAVARVIADRWKNLPAPKKVKYEDQAAVEMKKYRTRMQEYEQHMIKNSNISKRNEERMRQGVRSLSEPSPSNPTSLVPLPGLDASFTSASVANTEHLSLLAAGVLQPTPPQGNSRNSSLFRSLGVLPQDQAPNLLGLSQLEALRNAAASSMSAGALGLAGAGNASLLGTNMGRSNNNLLGSHLQPEVQSLQGLGVLGVARGATSVQPSSSNALLARRIAGLASLPNEEYAMQIQQQLRLEQELQGLARLQAQQQGLMSVGVGTNTLPSSAVASPAASTSGGLASLVMGSLQQRQSGGTPAISDYSSTGSTAGRLNPTEQLQLLRAQAMMGQRNEAILQQQQNEALGRLLRGNVAGAPSPSDLSDSNNSSQYQNRNRYT